MLFHGEWPRRTCSRLWRTGNPGNNATLKLDKPPKAALAADIIYIPVTAEPRAMLEKTIWGFGTSWRRYRWRRLWRTERSTYRLQKFLRNLGVGRFGRMNAVV